MRHMTNTKSFFDSKVFFLPTREHNARIPIGNAVMWGRSGSIPVSTFSIITSVSDGTMTVLFRESTPLLKRKNHALL